MLRVDTSAGESGQHPDSAQLVASVEVQLQQLILNQRELGAQLEQLFDALAHGDSVAVERIAGDVARLGALGVELQDTVLDAGNVLAAANPSLDRPSTVAGTIALAPVPATRTRLMENVEQLAKEIERVAITRLRVGELIRDLSTLQHQSILAFERLGTLDPLYGSNAQSRNVAPQQHLLNTSA